LLFLLRSMFNKLAIVVIAIVGCVHALAELGVLLHVWGPVHAGQLAIASSLRGWLQEYYHHLSQLPNGPWAAFDTAPPLVLLDGGISLAEKPDRPIFVNLASTASVLPVRSSTTGVPMSLHYLGHPIFYMLHIAAGLVWTLAAPLQLFDEVRFRWPVVHNTLGHMMVPLSVAIGLTGVLFPFVLGASALVAPGQVLGQPSLTASAAAVVGSWSWYELSMMAISAWFLYTLKAGYVAVSASVASEIDYDLHRRWIVRHVAAGLWVGLARLVFWVVVSAVRLLWTKEERVLWPVSHESHLFAATNAVAFVACVCAAEYSCRYDTLRLPRKSKSTTIKLD